MNKYLKVLTVLVIFIFVLFSLFNKNHVIENKEKILKPNKPKYVYGILVDS